MAFLGHDCSWSMPSHHRSAQSIACSLTDTGAQKQPQAHISPQAPCCIPTHVQQDCYLFLSPTCQHRPGRAVRALLGRQQPPGASPAALAAGFPGAISGLHRAPAAPAGSCVQWRACPGCCSLPEEHLPGVCSCMCWRAAAYGVEALLGGESVLLTCQSRASRQCEACARAALQEARGQPA